MLPFQISTDQNSWPTPAITFTDHINALVLSAGTPGTVTIPTGARFVSFSSTGVFYCRPDGTAALPSGILSFANSDLDSITLEDCFFHINSTALTPGVAQLITIPTGANFILFNSTADFYCRSNGVAAIPVSDIVDGSSSELNPVARSLRGVTTISIIAPTSCTVTTTYYT